MRFGENFSQGADPKNRMDVLRIKEIDQDIPEYIKSSLDIRNRFKNQIESEGWPVLPDSEEIRATENIFAAAKFEVDKTWDKSIQQIISSQGEEWGKNLKDESPEASQARGLLSNPEELQRSFSLRQFGVLEVLRQSNPEAWRTLVMASSERQLASIAVLEHWLKYSESDKLAAVCDKIGLSSGELSLFVDTAAILGKYIDHAYVKQIELADLPGGSSESKIGEQDGAQYLYDLYKNPDSEDIDVKTYSDIFPYEWDKIQSRLLSLASRVDNEIKEEKLPDSYQGYAALLKKMAQVYGSKNIKPEILDKEWDELYKLAKSVDDSGCPIMIIPQGCASVAGEAGKVDAEIRLGLKTKETKRQEQSLDNFTKIAQEMLTSFDSSLDKSLLIPKVNLNYQPWAFGPNLYWNTRGESNESQILSHTNAVSEVALVHELPLVKKLFNREKITEEQYAGASVVETALHETGHSVVDYSDKKVAKRIGKSFEVEILEELKAETVGMKIFAEAIKRQELPSDVDIRLQLIAKLGTNLDYLKNKSNKKASSGEPYYICGAAIIGRLLEKGLIKKTVGGYDLGDVEACIQEIASIGEEILLLYTDEKSKPADAKNYVGKLREQNKSKELTELIAVLKPKL